MKKFAVHSYVQFYVDFKIYVLETVTKKMTLAKKWANNKKSTILVQLA